MAWFSETDEIGVFVAPGLVPYIREGVNVNKDEIFILKFLYLGDKFEILVDKQFLTKHNIENNEEFDLEETGKEEIFFELLPVQKSKYLHFLKINNIEM
jgi:hypothetical protein